MALDTFLGLYQEVLDHGFGSARYLQYAKDKVNEAQLEVAKMADIEDLVTNQAFNTNAGTGSVGLVSNFLRLKHVYETTNDSAQNLLYPLPDSMTLESLDRLKRGRPTHWLHQGQSLFWYPVPDKTYSMVARYVKRPTVMSADADVPEVPYSLRPALVSYAVAMCYRREQDFQAFERFLGDFKRQVFEASEEQMRGDGDLPVQVPGMW